MRRLILGCVLSIASAISATAYADNIETFAVANATFASGATGSGTITIDTTIGTYVGLNFNYHSGASNLLFTTISGQSPYGSPGAQQYYFYSFDAAGDLLDLGVPGANLIGYNGGVICTTSSGCPSGYGYVTPNGGAQDFQATGSLVATPEPSSLALLGTGLIGIVGAVRRRMSAV